jgi:hydroxylaminobenzene mutase
MSTTNLGRRLAWHGVLLFFLALVEGIFVYSMRNPRMGLTTHVGGITTALFFLAIAALWRELRLSDRAAAAAWWMTVGGGYGSVASLLLAALLGTSRATPIAGAGFSAPPWQETLVTAALTITGVPLFIASVLLLWGFRAPASAVTGSDPSAER